MTDNTVDVELGSLAPDFSLDSNVGAVVRLLDYRTHKHVALYFMREFL